MLGIFFMPSLLSHLNLLQDNCYTDTGITEVVARIPCIHVQVHPELILKCSRREEFNDLPEFEPPLFITLFPTLR